MDAGRAFSAAWHWEIAAASPSAAVPAVDDIAGSGGLEMKTEGDTGPPAFVPPGLSLAQPDAAITTASATTLSTGCSFMSV